MDRTQFNTEYAAVRTRIDARLRMVERIAREVMGWHLSREDADEWLDSEANRVAPRSWSPLLDIAAAMEVVERLNALGWFITASQYGTEGWQVSVYSERLDEYTLTDNKAPTLAKAISAATIALLVGPLNAELKLSDAEYIEGQNDQLD